LQLLDAHAVRLSEVDVTPASRERVDQSALTTDDLRHLKASRSAQGRLYGYLGVARRTSSDGPPARRELQDRGDEALPEFLLLNQLHRLAASAVECASASPREE
jgi:hypothetical protein